MATDPMVCFRVGNRASGLDFGRILVGRASKSTLGPAKAGRRADFEAFPKMNLAEISQMVKNVFF